MIFARLLTLSIAIEWIMVSDMTDEITILISVRTQMQGSQVETELSLDRKNWNAMTSNEKEDECRDAMFDLIEWNWRIEDD